MFPGRSYALCLVAVVLCFYPSHAWADRLFPSNFVTQTVSLDFPDYPSVADLNGDGIPDLVFSNHAIDRVMSVFGRGDGTFGPDFFSNLVDSSQAVAILFLDLSGDGKADCIQYYGSHLHIFVGNGDGTFGPPIDYGSAPGYGIEAGDVNGDGKVDIVSLSNGHCSVWLNHGDGTLEAPFGQDVDMLPVGYYYPPWFRLIDINADGKLDLAGNQVVQDTLLQVAVALGHGDGTFDTAIGSVSNSGVHAFGDLDGDGKVDALGFRGDGSGGFVLFGNGDGTFVAGPTFPGDYWNEIADVNGDGREEAIGFDFLANVTLVQSIQADRSLGQLATYPAPVITSGAWKGFVDLDGDGLPDGVTTGNTSALYSVVFGSSNGWLESVPEFATGSRPVELALADLNGDGRMDVVTANADAGTISVLLAQGSGFAPRTDYPAGAVPKSVALGDLDGDGLADAVVADSLGNDVQVLRGLGGGAFQAPVPFAAGLRPNSVALADFDHDGLLDVVVLNSGASTISVLRGLGGGALAAPSSWPTSTGPVKLAVGNLDSDVYPDVAVITRASGTGLYVFRGDGLGGLSTPAIYSTPSVDARDVLIGDLTGDGKLDVVTVTRNAVRVYPGNGDGTLASPLATRTARGAFGGAVGDLDGDGKADVVVAADLIGQPVQPFSGGAACLRGRGDGTFDIAVSYGTDGTPSDAAIADFDLDGLPDVVVAGSSKSTISLLRHRVTPSVAVLASPLRAEAAQGMVRLIWQGEPYLAAKLSRRVAGGPWSALASIAADASGRLVYEDRAVSSGESYSYRLSAIVSGLEVSFGEISVHVPLLPGLALAGVTPNPATGPWNVSFSLPGMGPARLEVVDLSGRIVAAREVGRFGEGEHVLALPETGSLSTGVYFLRLTRAGTTKLAKVCAIR